MADLPNLTWDSSPWLQDAPLADQSLSYDTTTATSAPDFIRASWYAQPYVGAPFVGAQPPARSAMLAVAGQPAVAPDLAFIRWPQAEV